MKAVAEVLNTDERYPNAAKNWEGEIVVLVEPDRGLRQALGRLARI
jgi:putative sterol carrier protein